MLSRVFGLARDTAFAVLFGTGFVADAFNLAFLLPNVFRRVVGEGNLNPAFIPVFTEIHQRRGREDAARFLRRAFGMLLVILVGLTALGMLIAEPLVRLYAHDWQEKPEDLAFAVGLLRLLFPYLLFAGGAAFAGAALNGMRHFTVPALSPILINVFFLAGAAASVPLGGLESRAFVFSMGGLVGGLAAWVVMFPKMRALGLPIGPAWAPGDPDLRRVGALMLPGLVALGVTQLNLFVDTLLALRLEQGSLTALRLGNRVTLLPLGVIGVAVSTAVLPTLSLRAAQDDRAALLDTLAHSLRLLLTLLVPATVALALLAEPVVSLLFQYGEFSAERSTPMTADALRFYAFGLPAYGLVKGLSQAFYSVQDTKTPVRIAAIAMVANILLNLALMGPLGLRGLALATSLAAWLNVALLLTSLRRTVGPLPTASLLRAFGRALIASGALGVGCVLGLTAVATGLPEGSFAGRLASVVAAIVAGLSALVLTYRLLGHREMAEIIRSLPGRGR
jgi:putative peptidoglycan lipid II flippase